MRETHATNVLVHWPDGHVARGLERRPVTLNSVFNGAGTDPVAQAYTVGFDGSTTIRRSDFGVKTYVPLIGAAVDIRISAAFVQAGNAQASN